MQNLIKQGRRINKYIIDIISYKILINIITKKQFHDVVLRDKKINMLDKNHSFVKNQEDEDIYHRPWGFYKTTFINKYSYGRYKF